MSYSIKTKSYKIEHIPNTNSYSLQILQCSNNDIYDSLILTNILSNAFLDFETNNAESIIFTAEKISPLSLFLKKGLLTNSQAIKMIHDLSKQIAYLETKMHVFYGFNLDDILVINDDTFIIASAKHLSTMNAKDKCIYFYTPIEKPYFSSPELNELTKLPSKIDYRISYYSLGAFVFFCLTNIYIFAELKEMHQTLDIITYPKLYWFLKRCFHEKCEQRILLFI
jgi:hypothetical protein